MSRAKKQNKIQKKIEEKEKSDLVSVEMKFPEDMYYNDLSRPIYRAGEVYTIVGLDMVQRWLKRGGIIVEGEFSPKNAEENPSSIVGGIVSEPQEQEEAVTEEESKEELTVEPQEQEEVVIEEEEADDL